MKKTSTFLAYMIGTVFVIFLCLVPLIVGAQVTVEVYPSVTFGYPDATVPLNTSNPYLSAATWLIGLVIIILLIFIVFRIKAIRELKKEMNTTDINVKNISFQQSLKSMKIILLLLIIMVIFLFLCFIAVIYTNDYANSLFYFNLN